MSSQSGGGTATWGNIGGTLSNQTDLQSTLTGKQPLLNVYKDKQSKLGISYNTDVPFFSFPLASGASEMVSIWFYMIATKAPSDYAIAAGLISALFYNQAGSLIQTNANAQLYNFTKSAGFPANPTSIVINPSLSASIVTVKFNTGTLGTTPDTVNLYFYLENALGAAPTYL